MPEAASSVRKATTINLSPASPTPPLSCTNEILVSGLITWRNSSHRKWIIDSARLKSNLCFGLTWPQTNRDDAQESSVCRLKTSRTGRQDFWKVFKQLHAAAIWSRHRAQQPGALFGFQCKTCYTQYYSYDWESQSAPTSGSPERIFQDSSKSEHCNISLKSGMEQIWNIFRQAQSSVWWLAIQMIYQKEMSL